MSPIVNRDDCSGPSVGDAGDYWLLHEIEAMSNALCRPQPPPLPHRTSTPSSIQTPSLQKSETLHNGSVSESGLGDCEGRNASRSRKSRAAWSWKNPLKALSRIRDRKFPCFFFLHVHSIEGLPSSFEEARFSVEFLRKDEALRTRPSRVLEGIADFDDTLMHRCTVYCRKIDGPGNSCKYEPKLFMVRAFVNEAPGIDLGKQRVDLTGLLPVTFEELGGGKSSGKWTTSFKLAREARGAVLNVSFGFSLDDRSALERRGDMTVSELISMSYGRSFARGCSSGSRTDGDDSFGRLRRSGSIPGSLESVPRLVQANPALELPKSIRFVYRKLNEDESRTRLHWLTENDDPVPVKAKGDSSVDSVEMTGIDAGDELEYAVIDRGIEISGKEKSDSVQGDDAYCRDRHLGLGCEEEMGADVDAGDGMNLVDLDAYAHKVKDSKECHKGVVTRYRTSRAGKKSASLDSGADFLAMHGAEQDLSGRSPDRDPESPRECLLREFKEEALASGSIIIGFDSAGEEEEEENESGGRDLVIFNSRANLEGSVITSSPQSSRDLHNMMSCSLKVRRKLNTLEDLETEFFRNSWQCDPSGFGSPVELSCA